jgi:tetratricopeptide (TPR) repeat protein
MTSLQQAELRFANYYLAALRTAGELYDEGGEALKRGLNLFDVEWTHFESGQSWAEKYSGETDQVAMICNNFPDAAPRLLDLRQHPRDRIRWLEAALTASRQLKDQIAEGRHLNYLGLAYSHLGELVLAIEIFKSSLEIFQLAGDRRAESEVLTNIGYAYANLRVPSLAITVSEQALTIVRELGDHRNEAIALCNLGQSFCLIGEFPRAIEFYEQSLKITRKIGYLAGENVVLNHLGETYATLDKPKQAIEFYEQALTIAREIGDLQGERNVLGNMGQAFYLLDEVNRAIEYYESALNMARRIGDPSIEVELNNLGDAYLKAGSRDQALSYYERRLKITLELSRGRAADVQQLFHDWSLKRVVNTTDDGSAQPSNGPPQRISWLHLSDFHFGGSESDRYDTDIVIESLLVDIRRRVEEDGLEPDFIAVTGDLALRGKSLEYKLVRAFFEKLLEVTGLPRQRLFVVPGNHDVDRTLIEDSTLLVGKGLTDRQITNKILANRGDRRRFFARFKGYSKFFNEYFKGHLVFDDERFFYVHHFDTGNRRVAILGLNSSWLAASDEDAVLKLVIGERQTRAALKAAEDASAAIKIVLLHHPNDWIRGFDQSDSMARLLTSCDFVLHGHLHKAAATHLSSPDGSAVVIAGGACYDTREHPNSYNFVTLDLEANTGTIYFREYVDQGGGYWAKGVRLYKNAPDGVYEFTLPHK